jgi:ribosomal protein S5
MCQLAGIKNVSSKMLGTTKNKLNNARATMKAFSALKREADIKAMKESNPITEVKTAAETETTKP